MDLRKLREHPDSELHQFKRKMKAFARFFVPLLIIISMAMLIFLAYMKFSKQINENRQINSEQDVQKNTADATKYAEIVRTLVEAVELQKKADNTLARHEQDLEIPYTLPIFQRQGKLPENVVEDILNQLMPNLVEELNTLSATEQRKLITQLQPLKKIMVDAHTKESDSVDVLLKTLRAHGFNPKF